MDMRDIRKHAKTIAETPTLSLQSAIDISSTKLVKPLINQIAKANPVGPTLESREFSPLSIRVCNLIRLIACPLLPGDNFRGVRASSEEEERAQKTLVLATFPETDCGRARNQMLQAYLLSGASNSN